ncbi:MAG: hypothetical protein ACXWG1_15200 [Usitatibacter sp.]
MEWRTRIEAAFTILIVAQFAVIVLHDWLDIPGWTHGSQVQAVVGRRKLGIATAINAVFPGIAVAFAIFFWNAAKPWYVTDYWIAYCVVTVMSAVAMWYVPYLFGTSERQKDEYARMYAGTRQVLPARGDNPRPNLLHLCFHALFVVNLALVIAIRFGGP